MIYTETPPAPELADRVECFWTIRSQGSLALARLNRVVPDNCNDIIFDFGDHSSPGGLPRSTSHSYAVGAMRRPLLVRLVGTVDLLGVRFRPGCGPAFIGVPAHELTDMIVPLDDLWGRLGRDAESIVAEADGAARVPAFAALLLRRRATPVAPHPAVAYVLRRIENSSGRIPVRQLSEAIGLSRRQLERLFAASVGVSPKTACRVARFRAAQRHLLDQPGVSLASIAFACGYADQPHFTREFTELAGISPHRYRQERADATSEDASFPLFDRAGQPCVPVASVQDDGRGWR